jgi:hypothetical protein
MKNLIPKQGYVSLKLNLYSINEKIGVEEPGILLRRSLPEPTPL